MIMTLTTTAAVMVEMMVAVMMIMTKASQVSLESAFYVYYFSH